VAASSPGVTGYAVTLQVVVPLDVAQRMVDRLDRSWRTESWTPEAAAFMVARKALADAGLTDATSVGTRAVGE
jgi:hypothetical protein